MFIFPIADQRGFTLLELMVSVAILIIIFSSGAVAFGGFFSGQRVRSAGEQVVHAIREARTRAITGDQDSRWGVYFDTASSPDSILLFKGNTYASRDTSFDRRTAFSRSVEYSLIGLSGGGNEAVFDTSTGRTQESGVIRLADPLDAYEINLNQEGIIQSTAF
jgi:prepilin-type N-terminal cleavage/methylation domain-containing protein